MAFGTVKKNKSLSKKYLKPLRYSNGIASTLLVVQLFYHNYIICQDEVWVVLAQNPQELRFDWLLWHQLDLPHFLTE